MAELEPARAVSRTIGHDRVVDEFVIKFARTLQMDWLLHGVPQCDSSPVQNGKIASERIDSDQASVPVQLGLNVNGFALI